MGSDQWTDAERERVISLLKNGYSRRDIGAVMGLSRNAAGGRIFRDKQLSEISRATRPPPKPKPQPKERRMSSLKFKSPSPPPRTEAPKVQQTTQMPKPEARRVTLVDLQADECKWPVEADKTAIGGQLFCGVATEEKRNWCPYHHFIGHTPPRGGRHG
ncbi:GcrA family cell cycle regulator [Rhizobium ruizarguesonis]|nr:GcrA family cell cycle regulator [Rhizobium ruizarguesonis]